MQIEGPKQVARRSDIDMNGHINNVTYLAWTQETVPLDTFLNYKLHQVCMPPRPQCVRSPRKALLDVSQHCDGAFYGILSRFLSALHA